MVTLSAHCPYCHEILTTELQPGTPVVCGHCQSTIHERCPEWAAPAMADGPAPTGPPAELHCLTCPSRELFVRKDFPQRLGVGIVVTGFLASSITWYLHQVIATYGILFATALIDVILYVMMGNVLECYRCHAQYRGLGAQDGAQGFDLEVHERYRQQAARLATPATAAHGSAAAVAKPSATVGRSPQ